MPPAPRKRTAQPETTELDTSQVAPPANSTQETTPVYDEVVEQHKRDLESADPADVTRFEEDDDPLQHVGELVGDDDEKALKPVEIEENA